MQHAAAEAIVPVDRLPTLAGLPNGRRLSPRQLSLLGVAVIPVSEGQVRLVGTSPKLAAIANQAFHGSRRRPIGIREVIGATKGVKSNGKTPSVTVKRRMNSLIYLHDEKCIEWQSHRRQQTYSETNGCTAHEVKRDGPVVEKSEDTVPQAKGMGAGGREAGAGARWNASIAAIPDRSRSVGIVRLHAATFRDVLTYPAGMPGPWRSGLTAAGHAAVALCNSRRTA
jgi:hypothetical protein